MTPRFAQDPSSAESQKHNEKPPGQSLDAIGRVLNMDLFTENVNQKPPAGVATWRNTQTRSKLIEEDSPDADSGSLYSQHYHPTAALWRSI
jgi:hypothetical protein